MKYCNKLASITTCKLTKVALLVWLLTIVIWSQRNAKSTHSLNTLQSLSLHCDALGCSLRALWWPGMHCGECASSSCASCASSSCPLCLRLSYTSHGPPTSSQPKKMPLHVMKNIDVYEPWWEFSNIKTMHIVRKTSKAMSASAEKAPIVFSSPTSWARS